MGGPVSKRIGRGTFNLIPVFRFPRTPVAALDNRRLFPEPLGRVAATQAGLRCPPQNWQMPSVRALRYRWEDTELQADLTMGNLASALTLQSEEAALIEELRAGSEEAFAWLIARFHQPIYSLLARTVQDRADAADLTQEVFVKVFRGVGSFHGESSLRTWIYRIALREASNQRRWWMRHKQQEVADRAGDAERGMRDRRCG